MRHRRRFRHTNHRSRHFRREVHTYRYSTGTSFAIGLFSTALLALAVSPHLKRLEVKTGVPESEPEKKDQ